MRTYQQRLERQAIVEWTTDDRFTHALTLNTDRELSERRIGQIFGCFCHLLDKAVHGRSLNRVPEEARLYAIAFPEKLSTNAHLHAVADLRLIIEKFGDEALALQHVRKCWLRATRGGRDIRLDGEPRSRLGRLLHQEFYRHLLPLARLLAALTPFP